MASSKKEQEAAEDNPKMQEENTVGKNSQGKYRKALTKKRA
jgi:hypothetical protein